MACDLKLSLVETLEESFPFVKREFEGLNPDRDFFPWPEVDGYRGVWSVFALFFNGAPYLPVDIEANKRRCPETAAMLESLPGLVAAGFSLVGPKSAIFPHRDSYAPNLQRVHLAVSVPPQTGMLVDGQQVEWQEGRVVQFDRSHMHSVVNDSDQPRVVLLCDFEAAD